MLVPANFSLIPPNLQLSASKARTTGSEREVLSIATTNTIVVYLIETTCWWLLFLCQRNDTEQLLTSPVPGGFGLLGARTTRVWWVQRLAGSSLQQQEAARTPCAGIPKGRGAFIYTFDVLPTSSAMDLDRPRRVNGLSQPYTPAQVSTWVFLPFLVLEFLFFCSPLLPVVASIPITLVFAGLAASSTYYGYVAMNIDPADPLIRGSNNTISDEDTKHCWLCDCRVHTQSMHCKYCNKCVDHFDHHCMWLNTCIGKANYKFFYRTMVSTTTMLVIHGAVQFGLILDIFVRAGGAKLRTEDWFSADATIPIVVVLVIFFLFDLIAFSLMSQLLAFHVKLQREGLTTYAFIVEDNQRRREKTKLDNEFEANRAREMDKANQEGRYWYHTQLRTAGWLRKRYGVQAVWDPLRGGHEKDERQGAVYPIAESPKDEMESELTERPPSGTENEALSPTEREILQAATDMESFEAIPATASILLKK